VSNNARSHLAAQARAVGAPLPEDSDPLYNSALMRRYCGGISPMTEWRWTRDFDFPKPDLVVARRKFWRKSTIDAWIDQMAKAAP
jgi:predicted DNA-binding transcriptional regulator AlpA